jgi:hypothetical protein
MSEHNYTGFRQCEPCGGSGFLRFGEFPYSFHACGPCGGSGQVYLELRGDAPKAAAVSAGASFAAQRTANATGAVAESLGVMSDEEIADACAAWKANHAAFTFHAAHALFYQGDDD